MVTIAKLVDASEIQIPIDLNKKVPSNNAGLCNQIFSIINCFSHFNLFQNEIFFDLFSTDIDGGGMISLNNIINIKEMREKYGYRIYDVTALIPNYNMQYNIFYDPYIMRTYHTNENMFSKYAQEIVFTEKYESISNAIIKEYNLQNKIVNLVHLRIDSDMEKHITKSQSKDVFDEIVSNYRKIIFEVCDKTLPLVLLMEDIEHPLVLELKHYYDVYYFTKNKVNEVSQKMLSEGIKGRELYALIDLLIGRKLTINNYIGLENKKHQSSFSVFLKHTSKYQNYYSA